MNALAEKTNAIAETYLSDEDALVRRYIDMIEPDQHERDAVFSRSVDLINMIREHPDFNKGLDAFLAEYSLDSIEGVQLMTLAEALARIPDEDTKESLIRSKLTGADWRRHLKEGLSPFVNSGTRALLFTSEVLETDDVPLLSDAIRNLGEPTIRLAIEMGMNIFSDHFVLGESLQKAGKKIASDGQPYRYSFDMLGEAAVTRQDADDYFAAYQDAISFAADFNNAAVSVKLSALDPRFDPHQRTRVLGTVLPRLDRLIGLARERDVQITIDAEEADRLELTLEILEAVIAKGQGSGYDKLGIAIQAYSKRALQVLEYIASLGEKYGQRICVRLVKGAYWDTEVKQAQMLGLDDYPVFTSKAHTDISYLACARFMIDHQDQLFPQFATHNVQTVSTLLYWTQGQSSLIEFQRLHGMGDIMYDALMEEHDDIACTIYAPIGPQEELLPYLIRRLLENSANSSFVNQLASDISAEELSRHPVDVARAASETLDPPTDLYPDRVNSAGLDPRFSIHREALVNGIGSWQQHQWGEQDADRTVTSPVDGNPVGRVSFAQPDDVDAIVNRARSASTGWSSTGADERANAVRRFADLLETHRMELFALCIREAGKTIEDGIAEVREAVDFCRYYAGHAEALGAGEMLPGPNGETNRYFHEARGVFVCISPWNFPVAIFTGQVVAALVTGNAVIAKPAEQTTLIAQRVAGLAYEAGIPRDVLQVVPGEGDIGAALVAHPGIDGVAFTGSVDAANAINRSLADRNGPIIPLIAETGGQNAMVVDSSALPEQVVEDVINSAFNSAGQRCSALRVLYVQRECADKVLALLRGAMETLRLGDPGDLATDVGPVIDDDALESLREHVSQLRETATLIGETPIPDDLPAGRFIAPVCFEIGSMNELEAEHFGPILHVVRYDLDNIETVIDEINSTGYGLTFGVHSRNERFAQNLASKIRVGNVYINRNMVGAVVGTQPFGGRGLSGTGPKAGGPNYLQRYTVEKTRTENTAAIGGAIDLINQQST